MKKNQKCIVSLQAVETAFNSAVSHGVIQRIQHGEVTMIESTVHVNDTNIYVAI